MMLLVRNTVVKQITFLEKIGLLETKEIIVEGNKRRRGLKFQVGTFYVCSDIPMWKI